MRAVPSLTTALGALLLAACGGGGGGSGEPEPLPPTASITSGNQAAVARAALDGSDVLTGPSGATGDRTLVQSLPAGARPLGVVSSGLRRVMGAGDAPRRRVQRSAGLAVTQLPPEACLYSGSITTTVNDADNNGVLSAGDGMTLTFNQCRDSAEAVATGAMAYTVTAIIADTETRFAYSATVAFQQFGVAVGDASASVNGSVSFAFDLTTSAAGFSYTIGSDSLVVTNAAPGIVESVVYNPGMRLAVGETFSPLASALSVDGTFEASSIGGRVAVATAQPMTWRGADLHPSSGQMVVTGAGGSRVRMTAVDASLVQLELDANGDGTYEGSTVIAWSTLRTR
ncbi:MAG TPA: hypothetical protein VFZ93_06335 [Albitalea sp.]